MRRVAKWIEVLYTVAVFGAVLSYIATNGWQ